MSNDSSLSQEQISMADLRSIQSTQACKQTSRYRNTNVEGLEKGSSENYWG